MRSKLRVFVTKDEVSSTRTRQESALHPPHESVPPCPRVFSSVLCVCVKSFNSNSGPSSLFQSLAALTEQSNLHIPQLPRGHRSHPQKLHNARAPHPLRPGPALPPASR